MVDQGQIGWCSSPLANSPFVCISACREWIFDPNSCTPFFHLCLRASQSDLTAAISARCWATNVSFCNFSAATSALHCWPSGGRSGEARPNRDSVAPGKQIQGGAKDHRVQKEDDGEREGEARYHSAEVAATLRQPSFCSQRVVNKPPQHVRNSSTRLLRPK
jgi:hypothetical protein